VHCDQPVLLDDDPSSTPPEADLRQLAAKLKESVGSPSTSAASPITSKT
jgi:hypothetical protein